MTSITHPSIPREAARPGVATLLRRLVRGRAEEATWVRPAQFGLAAFAALLYLVNLTVSGFANTYYSAAALAAAKSWSAWFFGSFDAANFITVDKPPLATMLMGLSVRLFGLSSWSILLPEALAGVATVLVLFAVVRRSFGPVAAVIAGAVMAVTPVAVLIFRFNNPDALLTLLLVSGAWALVRSLDSGRLRWVILAAVFVGLAFNTKYLQAYLVLPAFALTYLVAAAGGLRRRLGGLLAAGLAVFLSSFWWVAVVQLLPASARPYIGGSTTNSALELLLGYDGLGRIFGFRGGAIASGAVASGAVGAGPAGGGPGGGGAGFSGVPGLLRLFNAQFGGQISWLIPFSLISLVTGLGLRWRARRHEPARAGYLLWGTWFATHALVFSFMSGIIHSYYAVALAPAIAALVGAGAVDLWALRARGRFGGLPLASAIFVTALWAGQLLARTPDFAPGLDLAIPIVGGLVALFVAIPAAPARRRTQLLAAGLGLAILLAGPAAYAFDTMTTAYSGGDPKAGPASADSSPGGFGRGPASLGAVGSRGFPGSDGNGASFGGPGGPQLATSPGSAEGTANAALVSYLLNNRGGATWIVATTSAMQAGSIELAAGEPVMAMGGFSGGDPAPTLDQLKAYVASGKLRFVLLGGAGFGPAGADGSSVTSQINAWVQSVGKVVDYGSSGGLTLYDLSGAVTGS